MTRSQMAIGGGILVIVVAGAVWLSASGCNVDRTVTEPVRERNLVTEEIRSMLKSDDFKARLEASRQVDKLGPEEKINVLIDLSKDSDPAARILAAKKLSEIDDPRAKETLAKLAKEDPDPEVREMAGGQR